MDDTLTVGSGTALTGTAVTETPAQETGTGSAAPEGSSTGPSPDAGTSQESSDNGQSVQQERRWTKIDEIKELRSQRREMRQQMQTLQSQLEELRQSRSAPPPDPRTTARTPANFWQDPEAAMQARLDAMKDELRDGIVNEFHNVRQFDQQTSALNQERGEAVEFIRSQPGYSPEDDEDLIQIIEENNFSSLNPMSAARAAWSILQQSRGITDKSLLKRQAASVQGQPPGAGLGKKIWSQAEYDQVLNNLEKDPQKLTKELEAELLGAVREGRVR